MLFCTCFCTAAGKHEFHWSESCSAMPALTTREGIMIASSACTVQSVRFCQKFSQPLFSTKFAAPILLEQAGTSSAFSFSLLFSLSFSSCLFSFLFSFIFMPTKPGNPRQLPHVFHFVHPFRHCCPDFPPISSFIPTVTARQHRPSLTNHHGHAVLRSSEKK